MNAYHSVQKKVFWRPVWFKLFCTSAEPAVTLLSVWRCRNLASFYLPLTPRNPHVRKLFICIRKKQFAFWAVTLTIGNFFLFLCFQLKMKKKSRQVYWLTSLFIIRIGGWIFRFLIELFDKSGLTVRAWFVWIPDKGLSPWISMLQMAAEYYWFSFIIELLHTGRFDSNFSHISKSYKWLSFQKVLMHLSFLQTCEPFIFLSLKIWTLVTEICLEIWSLIA